MMDNSFSIDVNGINRAQVSGEFTEHAEEERAHADNILDLLGPNGA